MSSHCGSSVDPPLPTVFFYCSSFLPSRVLHCALLPGWMYSNIEDFLPGGSQRCWILYVFENLLAFAFTLPYSGSFCRCLRVPYPLSHSPLTPAILLLPSTLIAIHNLNHGNIYLNSVYESSRCLAWSTVKDQVEGLFVEQQ